MPVSPNVPIPPTDYYIGKIEGEWPVHLLESEIAATRWYEEKRKTIPAYNHSKIHLWRITGHSSYDYLEYVPPSNPTLKVVER